MLHRVQNSWFLFLLFGELNFMSVKTLWKLSWCTTFTAIRCERFGINKNLLELLLWRLFIILWSFDILLVDIKSLFLFLSFYFFSRFIKSAAILREMNPNSVTCTECDRIYSFVGIVSYDTMPNYCAKSICVCGSVKFQHQRRMFVFHSF